MLKRKLFNNLLGFKMIKNIIITFIILFIISCGKNTPEPRLDFTSIETMKDSTAKALDQASEDDRKAYVAGMLLMSMIQGDNAHTKSKHNLQGKTLKEAIKYLSSPDAASKPTEDLKRTYDISYINKELSKRTIPECPITAEILGKESGGLFALYYFLAIKLEQNDLNEYEEKLKNNDSTINEYGEVKDGIVIIRYAPTEKDFSRFSSLGCKWEHNKTVNDQELKWWNPDKIQKGTVYSKSLPDNCRYQIYIDKDKNIIYIYWCYS